MLEEKQIYCCYRLLLYKNFSVKTNFNLDAIYNNNFVDSFAGVLKIPRVAEKLSNYYF